MPKQAKVKSQPSSAKSGGNTRADAGASARKRGASTGAQKKSSPEITGLAEFISYAYSCKGRKLALTSTAKKAICKNFTLDKESESRLLDIAKADTLLAVPRQILLSVQEITGFTTLKRRVAAFIGKVIQMHPVFSLPEVKGVFGKIENITDPRSALAALASADYSKLPVPGKAKRLTATNIQTLRVNATYALAVWLYATDFVGIGNIHRYLFSAIWKPKKKESRSDGDEVARLRLITDIRDLAGVGAACLSFKEQYEKRLGAAESAETKAERKVELAEKEKKLLRQNAAECDTMVAELRQTKSELQQALATEKENRKNMRIHLINDMEILRARVLKRLNADVRLLSEGLQALRESPENAAVMDDHADRVLESLTKEINALSAND